MIDVTKINYKVIFITSDGMEWDITDTVQSLDWEENDGELAARITLTAYNAVFGDNYMSWHTTPNDFVRVLSSFNGEDVEVARGRITEWEPQEDLKKNVLKITAYDELYFLEKSHDNRYIAKDTGTKTALLSLFEDWGVPVDAYDGPDVPHAKKAFKNKTLADMVTELLDDAKAQGAGTFLVRCSQGKVSIVPRGGNQEVYHFTGEDNAFVGRDKISTSGMVTRVKVVGKEDDDGRTPVEAVVDGQTQYGIFQAIQNRGQDDSLEDATNAANDMIKEKGQPKRTTSITVPDVPAVRKGDKVHVAAGPLNDYFYVKSVSHNADSRQMKLDLEAVTGEAIPGETAGGNDGSFEKGDHVVLNGFTYSDSFGAERLERFEAYHGVVTIKVDTTRPCPFQIDTIGWVAPDAITLE